MNEIFKDYPDVVTIEQLQKMLNIGRNSAYELVRNDAIKTVKVGTRYLIPKANVICTPERSILLIFEIDTEYTLVTSSVNLLASTEVLL